MITLNLIPENEKRGIQSISTYMAIKNFVFLLFIGIIISCILLLMGKIILMNHYIRMVSNTIITSRASKFSDSGIKSFKMKIENAEEIQKNYIRWSNFFLRINSIINKGVIINSLQVDDAGKLSLSGIGKTRQDLLDFEKNIQKSGYFKEFKFPYETMFKKDDIPFTILLEFKANSITQTEL